jgi:uncharacterized phage protein (TIGR01671 family)
MRDIKFRAWDKKRKIILQVGSIDWTKRHRIEEVWCAGDKSSLLGEDIELMQYTGLKDKNGKEIYEGDIVEAEGQKERYLQIIEFHNTQESCGRGWIGRNIKQLPNLVNKTPEKDISDRFSYFCWPTIWKVIGNIYENPELLSKGG